MTKWQFYVNRPSGNFWTPYEKVEAGMFEGTLKEAQAELSARISRTWSPYVTHEFEASEQITQVDRRVCPDCGADIVNDGGSCFYCETRPPAS